MYPVYGLRMRSNVLERFAIRLTVKITLSLALIFALPTAGYAHDHRKVNQYELTVGFNVEPAYVGQMNAAFLRVMKKTDQAGTAMKMDVNAHASFFASKGLKHNERFTFKVTAMHKDLTIPYHSHLTGKHLGKITVSESAQQSGRVEIMISDNAFHPAEVTVKPGTVLVWTNHDDGQDE